MTPRSRNTNPQTLAKAATLALAALCCVFAAPAHGQENPYRRQQPRQSYAPAERQNQGGMDRRQGDGQSRQHGDQRQNPQHLSQWMDSHRNMTPEQQQRALAAEPGFRQLQPQVQQRMYDRLNQLNQMQPAERQRTLSRTEQMERLAPAQRQQIRGAMQQLGSLPEDRRRAVARTYHQLNAMPQQQRDAYLNGPQYRSQFNDQERSTMTNLLTVSPYLPQTPPAGPQAPR